MDQSAGSQAAAVFKDSYPVRWAGRQAVVVLPEHIGHANAPQVSEQLLSVINRGAAGRGTRGRWVSEYIRGNCDLRPCRRGRRTTTMQLHTKIVPS